MSGGRARLGVRLTTGSVLSGRRAYARAVSHPSQPPDRVLDLFAAEGVLERLEGGQGTSWRAGDLVLSPGHDESEAWLAPVQARLAVRLDDAVSRSIRLARRRAVARVAARRARRVAHGRRAAGDAASRALRVLSDQQCDVETYVAGMARLLT